MRAVAATTPTVIPAAPTPPTAAVLALVAPEPAPPLVELVEAAAAAPSVKEPRLENAADTLAGNADAAMLLAKVVKLATVPVVPAAKLTVPTALVADMPP